ncbi:MAG: hypothetical protein LBC56_00490 [Oscillospiraceae bacterium]|jgi:hypothetical protein|nr:hypothetical protein [Oscillospiraceae bacterium]
MKIKIISGTFRYAEKDKTGKITKIIFKNPDSEAFEADEKTAARLIKTDLAVEAPPGALELEYEDFPELTAEIPEEAPDVKKRISKAR